MNDLIGAFSFILVILGILMIGAGPYLIWWLITSTQAVIAAEKRPIGPPIDDSVAEIKRIKAKEKKLEGL